MPKTITRRFDFSGGLNTRMSELELQPKESPSLKNVSLGRTGALTRRPGTASYGTIDGDGVCHGIFVHQTNPGVTTRLIARGTEFYRESSVGDADWNDSAGVVLDDNAIWTGQNYDGNLYLANGVDNPKLYDGDELEDWRVTGTLPVEWVDGCAPLGVTLVYSARNEKMLAWNAPGYQSRLWWSKDTDPSDWDIDTGTAADGGFLDFLPDSNEPIMAVTSLHDMTFVFKRTICGLYAYGNDTSPFVLQQVLPVGCSSQQSLIRVGKSLYFWSDRGPVSVQGMMEYGDVAPDFGMSKNVLAEVDDVNREALHQIVGVHRQGEDVIEWFYPPSGSLSNTRSLEYNLVTGSVALNTTRNVMSAYTWVGSGGDGKTIVAGDTATIGILGEGMSDLGTAIDTEYITAWDWAGDISADKRLLRLSFQCMGDYDVDVYIQWDDGAWASLGNLEDLNNTELSAWDTHYWDVDLYWDRGQTGLVSIYPTGRGKRYRLKFISTSANRAFHLLGYEAMLSVRPNR